MTIDRASRGQLQQDEPIGGAAFCPTCGAGLEVGDRVCWLCGALRSDGERAEADAGSVQVDEEAIRHSSVGRSGLTGAVCIGVLLTALVAVTVALVSALGNSGVALSQKHAAAAVVLVGFVGVSAAAMLVVLALCRAAAAGDQVMVEAVRAAAFQAGPDLPARLANLEWAKGQRRRREFGDGSSAPATVPRLPLRARAPTARARYGRTTSERERMS